MAPPFFLHAPHGARLLTRRRLLSASLATLLATALMTGCSSTERAGELVENRPPSVWLSAAPPEGTVSNYRVHLYWGGWDPDGEIAYYEYIITDNGYGMSDPSYLEDDDHWRRVYGNDSVFAFTADQLHEQAPTSMVAEFQRSHTFYIRSVDEYGLRSPEYVHRSFTASTLSPEVTVTIPPHPFGEAPIIVPSVSTLKWRAKDHDGGTLFTSSEPESIQYALISAKRFDNSFANTLKYLRTDPRAEEEWEPWQYYKAPDDSGKVLTTKALNLGSYVFALRAKDEAGAVTPVLDELHNVRFLQVAPRTAGPTLTVANEYLGTVTTASCGTSFTAMEYASGLPITFAWCAVAEHYGGVVTSYRYGWDISDLNDPDQWATDFTPFTTRIARSPARTFFFGVHTFTVEVIDNNNNCSRLEIKVNVIRFTFDRNLMIVDDFKPDESPFQAGWINPRGLGIMPNDEEHDAFWHEMVENVYGFVPGSDEIRVESGFPLSLTAIAPYKCLIWSVYGNVGSTVANVPKLYDLISYRRPTTETNFCPTTDGGGTVVTRLEPNLLRLYMAAGGKVLIAGNHPMSQTISNDYASHRLFPFFMRYDMEGNQDQPPERAHPVGDKGFGYLELCLDILDFAYLTSSRNRSVFDVCTTVSTRPVHSDLKRLDTMREAIPIDPHFEPLTLRPECSDPGRFYDEAKEGLDVEVYNPAYFFEKSACEYSPIGPRACFEPIYALKCLHTEEPTYGEAVAFWTSTYADVVPDAPGGVAARSAVFGFPPVMFNPDQVKPGIEHILFDEWQLPRR